MNREQALLDMIKYRDILVNDESDYDAYANAWEFITDSEKLSPEEMPLVVSSFFDKPYYGEFLQGLMDLVMSAVENEEDFKRFIEAVLKNREGIGESCEVLDAILFENDRYIAIFLEYMLAVKIEKEDDYDWYRNEMKKYAENQSYSFFPNLLAQLD